MKFTIKNLFIIGILSAFGIILWLLLTPSLSSEIVFLSYSKNRLFMNIVAIIVFLFLLICLWSLRSKNVQKNFIKVFSSKSFVSLFLLVILIILISLILYLGGSFGGKSIYYEKMSPLILLFFILSVEVLIYLYSSTNGNVFRSLSLSLTNLINEKTFLFIGLILCIYCAIIFGSLSKGHNWGDDFAQYLLQSKSLLTGTVDSYIQGTDFSNNNSTINSPYERSPITVPWGFPIFLLPFVKLFDQNILGLKLVNVIAYSVFLVILYKWSSIRLSKTASVLIMLFFAISPTFIQFHNQVISDIFFLLCSMISLLLIDIFISLPGKKILIGIFLGFSLFYASFTRMSGYFLLAALGFAQVVPIIPKLINKKRVEYKQLFIQIIPYLVFGVCYLIQKILLDNYYVTVSSVVDLFSFEIAKSNISYYFWHLPDIYSDLFFPNLIYLMTLPLMLLGIIANRRSILSWSVIFYAVLTLGLYICFPGINGIRYLFPILPIYIVYIALGITKIIALLQQKHAGTIFISLAFICSLIFTQYGISDIKYAIRNLKSDRIELTGPYSPKSTEMFDFIRKNTHPDDVIVFFKHRAMKYFTGQNSIFSNTCQGLSQGDYLVWMKAEEFISNGRQMNLTEFEKCIESQKLVMKFENDENAIYEILD